MALYKFDFMFMFYITALFNLFLLWQYLVLYPALLSCLDYCFCSLIFFMLFMANKDSFIHCTPKATFYIAQSHPGQNFGMFPLEQIRDVGVRRERRKLRLSRHDIIFEVFQPM